MTKKLLAIGATVISFTVTLVILYTFVLQPLSNNSFPTLFPTSNPTAQPTSPSLTPARDLEGTWKTKFATRFNIQIDGVDVGYEDRMMTWIITPTSQENIVNVEVTFTYSNRQLEPYSGYTPDVSPMFLTGTISGTRLTLESSGSNYDEPIGEFNFLAYYIEGTWHDHWEMLYDQNVYTATNGLKLDKQ